MGLNICLAISVKTYCLDIPSLDVIVGDRAVPPTPRMLFGKLPMLSYDFGKRDSFVCKNVLPGGTIYRIACTDF
jgi:hypothetical protein